MDNLWIVLAMLATVFWLLGLALEWLGKCVVKIFQRVKSFASREPQSQEIAPAPAGDSPLIGL